MTTTGTIACACGPRSPRPLREPLPRMFPKHGGLMISHPRTEAAARRRLDRAAGAGP
jgi:hypothetical protein